jgi:hypothetical protein
MGSTAASRALSGESGKWKLENRKRNGSWIFKVEKIGIQRRGRRVHRGRGEEKKKVKREKRKEKPKRSGKREEGEARRAKVSDV